MRPHLGRRQTQDRRRTGRVSPSQRAKRRRFVPVLDLIQRVDSYTSGSREAKVPQKTNRNLGSRKDIWCEFHKGFEHGIKRCLTLSH